MCLVLDEMAVEAGVVVVEGEGKSDLKSASLEKGSGVPPRSYLRENKQRTRSEEEEQKGRNEKRREIPTEYTARLHTPRP